MPRALIAHFRIELQMEIRWITKDGKRIPMGSNTGSAASSIRALEPSRYLTTNAICPVCGSRVVYYQNENGSRVFFNEVGWPWEKHDCTKNSSTENKREFSARILGRTLSLSSKDTYEFLNNGYLIGHYDDDDESHSFYLLRLKNSKNHVIFVECSIAENDVQWDTLHDADFFLRRIKDTSSQSFPLWFFRKSGESDREIQEISVKRIPFDEGVAAFRS